MRDAKRLFIWIGGITIGSMFLPTAWGHFGILVPDSPVARRGEPITLRYSTGHPFECQIVDTVAPEKASVLLPDGKTRLDLKSEPKQVDNPEGGKVTVQTLTFTPAERGDHLVVVTTPLHFDEHAGGFVQDELKVLIRVQVQKGWDSVAGQGIELIPLTRPYGLKPGCVLKAQARLHGKPLADAEVEIERYNLVPPKSILEDEALVTQIAKTDVNGYVIATLDEPGWWGVMVTAEDGTKEKDGKAWPVVRRGIMWVYVEGRGIGK